MKPLVCSLAALMVWSPLAALAETVSEAAAAKIERQLDYYLPENIAKDGLLRVHASGDHYELTINPAALLTGIDRSAHPSAVTPLVLRLGQGADGLWTLSGKGNMKVAAQFTGSLGRKGKMVLEARDIGADIVFDPALAFPRMATIALGKSTLSAGMDNTNLSLSLDALNIRTSLDGLHSGIADLKANVTADNMVVESGPVPFRLSLGTFATDWDIGDANLAGARKVAGFLFEKQKQGFTVLTASEEQRLRAIYKAQSPFTSRIAQTLSIGNGHLRAGGDGALGGLRFSFAVADDSDETRIGLSADKPFLPSGALPYGLADLMPEAFSSDLTVSGLRWGDGMAYAFEHASSTSRPTPEQNLALRNAMLPGGRLKFSFDNTFARSAAYDLAIKGWLSAAVDARNAQPQADLTITARDFDKTLAYLQSHAAKVPQFKQAAFMLQAAKGFARQDASGATVWDLEIDPAGKLTVNGRLIPR